MCTRLSIHVLERIPCSLSPPRVGMTSLSASVDASTVANVVNGVISALGLQPSRSSGDVHQVRNRSTK